MRGGFWFGEWGLRAFRAAAANFWVGATPY